MITAVIISELTYKAIRSSGAGGQHVNKVSSKIELTFDLMASQGLTGDEKLILQKKLSSRITKAGLLVIQCGESRSQHRNKDLVVKRLVALLKNSLVLPKSRKATKVPTSIIKKRKEDKKRHSLKKTNRKKPL